MTVHCRTLGRPSRLSTMSGVAMLYGRLERGEVEPQRVAEAQLDVGAAREALGQVGLERGIELDRVHVRDALGQVGGEDPETGADLEHHVARLELGQPADHAEDVLVDEEVLTELLLRRDHRENAVAAFASIRAASSSASSLRASASAATISTTFAGSFGPPRR